MLYLLILIFIITFNLRKEKSVESTIKIFSICLLLLIKIQALKNTIK